MLRDDFRKVLDKRRYITEKSDREPIDSILEAGFGANRKVVELIVDESMYESMNH